LNSVTRLVSLLRTPTQRCFEFSSQAQDVGSSAGPIIGSVGSDDGGSGSGGGDERTHGYEWFLCLRDRFKKGGKEGREHVLIF